MFNGETAVKVLPDRPPPRPQKPPPDVLPDASNTPPPRVPLPELPAPVLEVLELSDEDDFTFINPSPQIVSEERADLAAQTDACPQLTTETTPEESQVQEKEKDSPEISASDHPQISDAPQCQPTKDTSLHEHVDTSHSESEEEKTDSEIQKKV